MDDMILRRSLGILAIGSALCLGGYFVWYRHHQSAEKARQEPELTSPDPLILSSSKHLDVVFKYTPARDFELLPSSKSFRPLKPEDIPITRDTMDEILEKHGIPEAILNPETPPK